MGDISQAIATVVGALIAFLGTLLSPMGEDLRFRILPSKRQDPLLGKWKCHWTSDAGTDIVDQVEVTKVRGELVKGVGMNSKFGSYRLSGRVSRFVVTFEYSGEGTRKNLHGVIILRQTPLANKMEGAWVQYYRDGALRHGRVVFEKLAS